MRQDISARDCLLSNLKAGVLTGALAGIVQFLVFEFTGVYLMESAAVNMLSFIQIVGINSLLFAGFGLLMGLLGHLVFARSKSLPGRALAGPQPAPMWTFGVLAIPAIWLLSWFNFSFRPARDPLSIAMSVVFVLALLVGAVFVQVCRYRSASAAPRSKTRRPSMAAAIALALGACCMFLLPRSSLLGLIDLSKRPAALRGPLAADLYTEARSALPDSSINIVLLTAGTVRLDHLGCYGYGRDTSPTIDSLAASGARFNNALVQCPLSGPSLATMFTGTYPSTHGVVRACAVLDDNRVTLAEILRTAGYTTCAVIAGGNLHPAFNYSQGFDNYHYGGRTAPEGVTGAALEWLASSPPEPFFVWVHYAGPPGSHPPRPPYDRMFDPADNPKTSTIGSETREDSVAGAIARYDGSIRRTDDAIAGLLSGFRRAGAADRSLLVLTTDRGQSFQEHGGHFGQGEYLDEAMVRAPLVVTFPGIIPPELSVDAPMGTVDIMPTLLDAAGVPMGESIQGHSFLPTALGMTGQSPGDFAFAQAGVARRGALGRVSAIRSKQYKYILRRKEWGRFPADPVDWLFSITGVFDGGLSIDELYAIQDAREVDNLIRKDQDQAKLLKAKMDGFLAYLARRETTTAAQPIDPSQLDQETYEQLKSLGYLR